MSKTSVTVIREARATEDHSCATTIATLTFGIAATVACLGCGIAFAIKSPVDSHLKTTLSYPLPNSFSTTAVEVSAFAINAVLTQCFEGLAYIHSISLRWALIEDDKLRYNTNLRLFTSSAGHGPNAWYSNFVSALCIVFAYAATSQLFIQGDLYTKSGSITTRVFVNILAVIVLGGVILLQTMLAVWAMLASGKQRRFWTSNVLNTTLVALNTDRVEHHAGRCMIPHNSRSDMRDSTTPARPSNTQPSMQQARPGTRWVVITLWSLVAGALGWYLIVMLVSRAKRRSMWLSWSYQTSWNTDLVNVPGEWGIQFDITAGLENGQSSSIPTTFSVPALLGISLLFVAGIQCLQTLGLHLAELVVITSRDEDAWRKLAKCNTKLKGVLKDAPYLAALTSWKAILLVILKTLLHWLLGQCLIVSIQDCSDVPGTDRCLNSYAFSMIYSRLLGYVICAAACAIFITVLAYRHPRGPQPAAWGHVQTLADLVDDWKTDEQGRFWWGDKGEVGGGARHAGTSYRIDDLGDVRLDVPYI